MSIAIYPAFFFTVVLLVTTAYFLLGGLPLLVLAHDVPLDARFIHSFFNLYYKAAFWAALGAAVSHALWGRLVLAGAQQRWWVCRSCCAGTCCRRCRTWAPRSRPTRRALFAAFVGCTARRCW